MFPCDRARICCPLSNLSLCLFPQRGCTRGLFRQSQHYMNVFCANMMDLNRRADAIGYAYPTRDIFMENSGPRTLL